jgi:hypothetical protein
VTPFCKSVAYVTSQTRSSSADVAASAVSGRGRGLFRIALRKAGVSGPTKIWGRLVTKVDRREVLAVLVPNAVDRVLFEFLNAVGNGELTDTGWRSLLLSPRTLPVHHIVSTSKGPHRRTVDPEIGCAKQAAFGLELAYDAGEDMGHLDDVRSAVDCEQGR